MTQEDWTPNDGKNKMPRWGSGLYWVTVETQEVFLASPCQEMWDSWEIFGNHWEIFHRKYVSAWMRVTIPKAYNGGV